MANKNTVRKLPMKLIKDEYNLFQETIPIDFEEDSKTYRVKLYPFFEPQRIDDMIERFGKDMKEISKTEIEFPDRLIPLFVLYHCVAEFSDFPISESKNIKHRISYFTQVVNTHYFKTVTDHFIQGEVNKVWDRLMNVMATNERLKEMVSKTKEEINNLDIKTPELRNALQEQNNLKH